MVSLKTNCSSCIRIVSRVVEQSFFYHISGSRDLIHTQHHHNNHTTIPHMRVGPSVWGPPSCEELLCDCCVGDVNLTFSLISIFHFSRFNRNDKPACRFLAFTITKPQRLTSSGDSGILNGSKRCFIAHGISKHQKLLSFNL